MKPREPRRGLHVPARMRCGSAWSDICIKNMSTRGLMAETEAPPSRGTYIEIRRGTLSIVGRVIWSKGNRFGVRCQDRVDADAVVNEPRLPHRPAAADGASPERRRDGDREAAMAAARRADRNRALARSIQFAAVAGAGAIAAALVAAIAYDVLVTPLDAIRRALGGA